jgi:phage baseplate assembly protein W
MNKEFLGQGWSFPIGLNGSGDVALSVHEEDVRQAILIILGTNPGERVMRPTFGAGLGALVFEPISTTTMALAQHRVEEALIIWEPRIDNLVVKVTADADNGRLLIEAGYRVRLTNTFYNLVYPFYLMEGRES